jgi:hypothetical protein
MVSILDDRSDAAAVAVVAVGQPAGALEPTVWYGACCGP